MLEKADRRISKLERDLEALWIGREGNLKLKGSEGSAFGTPFGERADEEDLADQQIEKMLPELLSLDSTTLTPTILARDERRTTAPPATPWGENAPVTIESRAAGSSSRLAPITTAAMIPKINMTTESSSRL